MNDIKRVRVNYGSCDGCYYDKHGDCTCPIDIKKCTIRGRNNIQYLYIYVEEKRKIKLNKKIKLL